MTMIEVPRGPGEHSRKTEPGSPLWWPLRRGDGTMTATLACPRCGLVSWLSDHRIDAEGIVHPSVICGRECGFHSDDSGIRLLGWIP